MRTLIILIILMFCHSTYSQPLIEWSLSIGGSNTDNASDVLLTPDGGYLVSGFSRSDDGDFTENKGCNDIWVLKLDENREIEWSRNYGGSGCDISMHIRITDDGGYIMLAKTTSDDGDVLNPKGDFDFWLVKLSDQGDIEWQRIFGGSGQDNPSDFHICSDGGYIIGGCTRSDDGDIDVNKGNNDIFIVRTDAMGNKLWSKTLGGSGHDECNSIIESEDGGFVLVAENNSNDGDMVDTLTNTARDVLVAKLDRNGNQEWFRYYGEHQHDRLLDFIATSDGGYVLCGTRDSQTSNFLEFNGWVVKLNRDGLLEWMENYGGTASDHFNSVEEMKDGNFVVTGFTKSRNGQITNNNGESDYWLVKLDKITGRIKWQKTLGGTESDTGAKVIQTDDNGFLCIGSSYSQDRDIMDPRGLSDIWLVKLSQDFTSLDEIQSEKLISVYPNPVDTYVNIQLPLIMRETPFTIYNASGVQVESGMIDQGYASINTAYWPSGLYLLEVSSQEVNHSVRFFVSGKR